MEPVRRYALSLPSGPGHTEPPAVVVVHWTSATADGEPVYEDLERSTRVAIAPGGLARLLDDQGRPREPVLTAVALP